VGFCGKIFDFLEESRRDYSVFKMLCGYFGLDLRFRA